MNPVTAIVTYVIVWMIVFLAALPFGVRGQWEEGDIAHGTEPGAPANPKLLKKAFWTSLVAGGITLILYIVLTFGLIDINDLPGPDSYWE